jgi:predicted XRE-type DNA-binding protein
MKSKHVGSRFEDFLAEDGVLEECRAAAIKFRITREVEQLMRRRRLTKTEMARQLRTSRSGVERLLDPKNTSITLATIAKVAALAGKRVEFSLR